MANFRVHCVRFFEYQPKAIRCLSYNHSETGLALLRSDGSIEIWNVQKKWYQEKVIPSAEGDTTVAITWCGSRLFSASLDGNVVEYNLRVLKKQKSEPSNAGPVWCLAANPAQTQLAAGTEDGFVVLFYIDKGALTYERMFDMQDGRILTLSWHTSGDIIATGGMDNIRTWSVKTGRSINRITVPRIDPDLETVVWSLVLLHDMTIVSGDSCGYTSFWNGENGTLYKAYRSHKADVLTVCANSTGDCVASSGIDPQVVNFQLAPTSSHDLKDWVSFSCHSSHSHDVFAVAFVDSYLVSAGVDTMMLAYCLNSKDIVRLPTLPHRPLVHVAKTAHQILLNSGLSLELWKLGGTNQSSALNHTELALNSQPIKLLQINVRSGKCVVCSAISHDARVLAYSDQSTIRVFRVELDSSYEIPLVRLNKVTSHKPLPPAHRLHFLPDDSNSLVCLSDNGKLLLLRIDESSLILRQVDTSNQLTGADYSPSLLAVSPNGSSISVTDNKRNSVHLFQIEDNSIQYRGCTPKYTCLATALAFNPKSEKFIVAYTDRKILEYNIQSLKYTKWCKETISEFGKWLTVDRIITHISYCQGNLNKIIVHDSDTICVINKLKPFPIKAKTICERYKYILMAETMDADWLVVVELSPIEIMRSLPPLLVVKKFGT